MSAVRIEPMRREHLEAVVHLHRKCFGANDSVERLGSRFTRRTMQFFVEDALSFGFVALYEEDVIGFVVGRLQEFLEALNRYRRGAALISLLAHPRLLSQLGILRRMRQAVAKSLRLRQPRIVFSCAEGLSIRSFDRLGILAILAADADLHRLRATEQLLKAAHSFCRSRGMSAVRASVHRANVQSRFLYRRLGYVESPAPKDAQFILYYLALEPTAKAIDESRETSGVAL